MKNVMIISFYATCILLVSCQNKKVDEPIPEAEAIPEVESCKCFKGIGSSEGDYPISTFTFSNDQTISICGWQHDDGKTISEFNVFDCDTGNSITEYGAVQTCSYSFRNDTLAIYELKNMPAGWDWKYQLKRIGKELIVLKNGKLQSLGQRRSFSSPSIPKELQKDFIKEVKRIKYAGLNKEETWEDVISKLELMSIIKNKEALYMLKNLEKITKTQFDGGVREHYNDALSNIEWLE